MSADDISLKDLMAQLKEFASARETSDALEKEATLLLHSLSKPFVVTNVVCKECGAWFQTNYSYKAYCTRSCLKKALEKKGLEWDPTKSEEERWKGEPPSTIYPETLHSLEAWARGIIAYLDEQRQPTATTGPRTMASEATSLADDLPLPDLDFLLD